LKAWKKMLHQDIYLVNRGIALAYRDLRTYSQALDDINHALKTTADNSEIYYLKAQVLHEKGKREKVRI
jgi:tetratricopeptide (TPR) repeat protein